MAPNNNFHYLVNYISGLDKYKLGIQNVTLVLDNEKMSFNNNKFDFSISFDKIAIIEFMRSPFRMPNPLSPVNLNFAYTCFRIYYFDDDYPKSILFMMNTFANNLFKNNEDACKDLFCKLLNNRYDNFQIISPWGENKYDIRHSKIKKIYSVSYLGGHPENSNKFSRVDFYVLNDRFYIDGTINVNNFSAFEIPFNKIKVFELINKKHSSLIERFFLISKKTNKPEFCHIIFTDTKNKDISIYFSIQGSNKMRQWYDSLVSFLGR